MIVDEDTGEDADYQAIVKRNYNWRKIYPNHCRVCRGWGSTVFYESHGIGGQGEQVTEWCGALPEGVCHRCGANGMMDGVDKPCGFCGWNFDDGEN